MPFLPYMFAGDNPYYQQILRYQVAAVAAQGRSGQYSKYFSNNDIRSIHVCWGQSILSIFTALSSCCCCCSGPVRGSQISIGNRVLAKVNSAMFTIT